MSTTSIQEDLNQSSRDNLLLCLDRVYTNDNLFLIPQRLSKVVNCLSPFLEVRARGKFQELTWLEKFVNDSVLQLSLSSYGTLIVVVESSSVDLELLRELWANLGTSRQKINLIVRNLSQSFYYELCSKVFGRDKSTLLDSVVDVDLNLPNIRMSSNCRLLNWKTYPICIEDFVLTLDMANGGLDSYFNNPIELVSGLADAVTELISKSTSRKDIIKLKNVFAKGDHSSLLLSILMGTKLPELVSTLFSANEAEFYQKKLTGNTDLVILERNLDYFPLILSHMNYLGLLDDIYGTFDEFNGILENKENLHDELYENLKDLNFASIGAKLNKLAKYLQLEYSNSDKLTDLREIKQLVQNLGNLTTKHELVRKHTTLSEGILTKIKSDVEGDYVYNYREQWLELQNEIFDLEYRLQIQKISDIMEISVPFELVLCLVIAVSIINDGIRKKDLDNIERELGLNYGSVPLLILLNMIERKLVKVNNKGNDFFGAFTFGKTELDTMATTTTTTATTRSGGGTQSPPTNGGNPDSSPEVNYEDISLVGVSGGQDIYKSTYTLISKFWNLYPLEDDEDAGGPIESASDYAQPSFALTGATVPLLSRLVESLYSREFLKYKPVNSVSKRPNWAFLNLETMFKGQTVDKNLCDELDNRKSPAKGSTRQEYVVVVIIGGITRSEISALVYLQSKINKKILVVTSGLVTTKKLINSLS